MAAIQYQLPTHWIKYNPTSLAIAMANAKAAVLTLKGMPYQRDWIENLQKIELKREVAGTSRIEGAEFTDQELEAALHETPDELFTRSQRQARAASDTYKWIAALPDDRPVDAELIKEIHRRIVTGADDDHCQPGVTRSADQNVTFGQPRHRGAEGGIECETAFTQFVEALQHEYRDHDPLIQALAAHYHFAAMHPFLDGNGRTARALEALMLQRAGLRDFCFISMSNYYYDEKIAYLNSLSEVRNQDHDLTPFLLFGFKGIELQSRRVLREIQHAMKKALFRNLMHDLYGRLKTPRKRVIAERQIAILKLLLRYDRLIAADLLRLTTDQYNNLKDPIAALVRDLYGLVDLQAVIEHRSTEGALEFRLNLDWPEQITEKEFFERLKRLPKAKSNPFG